jgi:hypothetical protein
MPWMLGDGLIFGILGGVIIHADALGKQVAERDLRLGRRTATFWIFFSGMWFIGPVTYFAFRKKHPVLAKRCLLQLAVATAAWVAIAVIADHTQSMSAVPHLPMSSSAAPTS